MTLRHLAVTLDEALRKFVASAAGCVFFILIGAALVWVIGLISG